MDRKGIRELLEAAPDVLARSPNVRLVLAGGHRGCSGEDMSRQWLPRRAGHSLIESSSPVG